MSGWEEPAAGHLGHWSVSTEPSDRLCLSSPSLLITKLSHEWQSWGNRSSKDHVPLFHECVCTHTRIVPHRNPLIGGVKRLHYLSHPSRH